MLNQTYRKYLSRLMLTFSDLCDSDAQVASCLNFIPLLPLTGSYWTADLVREAMPAAYATSCSQSDYALGETKTLNYCSVIHATVCGGKHAM